VAARKAVLPPGSAKPILQRRYRRRCRMRVLTRSKTRNSRVAEVTPRLVLGEDRRALTVIALPDVREEPTVKLAAKCAFASVLTFATQRTARKGIAAHIVSHGNALELRALLRRARRTPCQAEAAGPPVRPVPHVTLRKDCQHARGGWPTRRSSRRTAGRRFPLRSPSTRVEAAPLVSRASLSRQGAGC
jgi:hypothetical protein